MQVDIAEPALLEIPRPDAGEPRADRFPVGGGGEREACDERAGLLVVGAEPDGIRAGARTALDGLVRIPMQRDVESLNVGAAAAIALHALSG